MVGDGLVAVINDAPGLNVVGVAASVHDAATLCRRERADVAVCDYQLSGALGSELPAAVADLSTRVLLVSGANPRVALKAAVEGGCAGFLPKTAGIPELIEAIRRVAADAAVFPADALAHAAGGDRGASGPPLTPREAAVLELLARAANSQEIAAELGIALNTTRNHVRSTLAKLGAKTRLEAVVIAARSGLVDLSPQD